jgi:hypothetical protein
VLAIGIHAEDVGVAEGDGFAEAVEDGAAFAEVLGKVDDAEGVCGGGFEFVQECR